MGLAALEEKEEVSKTRAPATPPPREGTARSRNCEKEMSPVCTPQVYGIQQPSWLRQSLVTVRRVSTEVVKHMPKFST